MRQKQFAAHIHNTVYFFLLQCGSEHHTMIHSKLAGFMFIPGQLSVGKL